MALLGSYKIAISAVLEGAGEIGSQLRDAVGDNKLKSAALVGGAAVGGAFVSSLSQNLNLEKEQDFVAAQLGLTEKQSARAGRIAGDLYSNNYGESIAGNTAAVGAVLTSLTDLKGKGKDAITTITRDALNLSSILGTDVTDTVNQVSILMKSGLAKSSQEAIGLLTAGAQKVGPALSGDLIDASEEYSQFFRQMGFTGEQAFGVLAAGADKGVYGIDKAGDAIKEFGIRATDLGDKGAQDAMKALGLNGAEMSKALLKGGDAAAGATKSIVSELQAIKDPAKQAELAIALFGTPLEDLGKANIPEFLKALSPTGKALGDVSKAADDLDATLNGNAAAGLETWKRKAETAFLGFSKFAVPAVTDLVTVITEKLGPILGPVIKTLNKGGYAAKVLGIAFGVAVIAIGAYYAAMVVASAATKIWAVVTGIASAVTKTWAAIQWVMNAALLANPIVLIVVAIIALVAVIVLIAKKTDWFQKLWAAIWPKVKAAFTATWEAIKQAAIAVWGFISNLFKTVWGAMKSAWSATMNFFKSIFTGTWNRIKNVFTTILNFFKSYYSFIWNGIVMKTVAVLMKVYTTITGWIKKAIDGVVSTVAGLWGRIVNFFTSIPGKIAGAIGDLGSIGRSIVEGLWGGISSMTSWLWDKLSGFAGGIMDGLKGAFGINSPSKLMRDEVGKNLGLGVGVGLTESLGAVMKESQRFADSVAGSVSVNDGRLRPRTVDGMAQGNGKKIEQTFVLPTPKTNTDLYLAAKKGGEAAMAVGA